MISDTTAWQWLETRRPEVNQNVIIGKERFNWEIMGSTKQGQFYLFAGQTLKECVMQAIEELKC